MSCFRLASLSLLGCALTLTTGCAFGPADTTPQQASLGTIKGMVHGGQQPVTGARVYVYATGTTAYAGLGIAASASNASTSLLTSAVLVNNPGNSGVDLSGNYYIITDSNGAFTVTGDYTCTLGTDVYLYVTGGNTGAGTNNAAGFLAALGACPSTGGSLASAVPFVIVNEVTTITTAYALAGFATDATHISSSGSAAAIQGMNIAFGNVNNLVNLATGNAYVLTPAGNGSVPQSLIYTLANILAACVNTTGSFTSSPATSCYTLFTDTSTSTTLDTATAAINLAHSPGVNVAGLFALQAAAGAPFGPCLSSQPNDFSLLVHFKVNSYGAYAYGIAIDGSGNVWAVQDFTSINPYITYSVIELSGTGTPLSSSSGYLGGGLNYPESVAIDLSGNVWVANYGNSSISKFNGSTGAAISPSTGYTGGGVDQPMAVAIDSSGNAWAANYGNSTISLLNGSTGAAISPSSGYTGGGLSSPCCIAVSSSGNVWVANRGNNSVTEFNGSTGAAISGSAGFMGGGLNNPYGIAIDASGNVWVADFYTNFSGGGISEFNGSTGAAISPSNGYQGGGLFQTAAIAIDGSGNVWATDNPDGGPGHPTGGLTELKGSTGAPISPSNGYSGGGFGIVVDGSGNVWITHYSNEIVEDIGIAAPVVTPLAVGVKNNTLGTRP